MSFIEAEFPRTISYKAQGGPAFNTTVNSGFSGFEQRNQNWQTARGEWTVSLETPGSSANVSPQTYIDQLTAFFLNVGGKANAFRIKDHKDYTNGASAQLIGVGDGITPQRQLVKNYISAGRTYQRLILKPMTSLVVDYLGNALLDTVNVTLNGVSLPKVAGYAGGGSAKYSLDETTGVVSFGTGSKLVCTKFTSLNGYVQMYYTVAGGTYTPTKNEQIIGNGYSNSVMNGTYTVVAVGPGWVSFNSSYSGGVVSNDNAGTTFSGCWGFLAITGVTYSGTNATYAYTQPSNRGALPIIGQRLNVFGFVTHTGNNGNFYVTGTGSGTVTVVNANAGTGNETNTAQGSLDWCPASGAGNIAATYQFHFPVRFDTDNLAIQLEESDVAGGTPIVSWSAITLREVRIPIGTSQG